MNEYYKEEFKEYQKDSKTLMNTSKDEMDKMMTGFIEKVIGGFILSDRSPLT